MNPPDIAPMLIWTDIPYNTGKLRQRYTGAYYDNRPAETLDALRKWSAYLHRDGAMVVCCDYRMAPQVCFALQDLGMDYRGEIIWTFGLGRPRTAWWPVRHNNLLTFANRNGNPKYDAAANPRERRLAPKPGYPADKPSGSVWEFTMSNTHPERCGYPDQKPLAIIEPFVLAHTEPGDLVADPFCGSSSTGVAAVRNGRDYYGCDIDSAAVEVSEMRLSECVSESVMP